MNGFVDGKLRALLRVPVSASRGGNRMDIVAWIDTAFNGGLVIPRKLIAQLGLVKESSAEATLADGQCVELETFACFFDWFGESYETQIVANEGAYRPGQPATLCMSSVALLILQYGGVRPHNPVMAGGVEYLMSAPPDGDERDVYYWYYATQVLHNMCGPAWDTWNRRMRRVLIESQVKEGCAAGSWDPDEDRWGPSGGRLMVTSLSALTLEIYYRYLPLYQLDEEIGARVKARAEGKAAGADAGKQDAER